MTNLSNQARNLNWLINNFATRTPGVDDALVVSSDGLPVASSAGLLDDDSDRLAAVTAGLVGIAKGASSRFAGGAVNQVIVELDTGFVFISGISDGSLLAVIASADADIGQVGYEMAVLVERVGEALTPELRAAIDGMLLQ